MPAHDFISRVHATDPDAIVVGAGVAGLATAAALTARGLHVQVLEATERVGGRTATRELDGFRLDLGGHLLNTAHPELGRSLDLDRLELRPLAPGVLVHSSGRTYRAGDPHLTPARQAATRSPLGTPLDRARLAAMLSRLAATPTAKLAARQETTAARALADRGLPARTVDGFLRPLLAALLSDPALGTSSRVADLVLRAYAQGRLCLPAAGIGAVPAQLAAALPEGTVRFGVEVTSVGADGVETAAHGRIRARAVVVATDAATAGALLPGLRQPGFHPVTTYYHAANRSPLGEPMLLLDAERSGISHSLVLSDADPSYAPDGRALIATTVLGRRAFDSGGPAGDEPAVRRRLAELYGVSTAAWEFLTVRHVPDAVVSMPPPHHFRRSVRLLAGLYVCGDHRDTGTLNGALASARRAAGAVLRDLGVRTDPGVVEAAA
ncbi:NAD(P)/FAD-dependent oxidoreductase [Kitasatospora cheerisanensis]|uniref:Oxidoreductase n=1 Tax=Kitasatospora cheerisanensis KCTC 2395 TaxID=1348663 RepID=A0A066Z2H0_9ACTN|nr:NAD(P)/FAD-dependent oxidoreductase [Kitasatospora cheerisanensis]KDN86444.1 oxidoreductase [Kitasatospora cheerisanensis KCTC 2395]